MEIREVLNKNINKLKKNNIEDAVLKAKLILSYSLDVSKEYLIINDNLNLSEEEINQYEEYINRLILNEPIQYIIGKQEFMKLPIKVNKNVLIPRSDTEILVEEIIKISDGISEPKILDMCTGSGAIAISLKKYIKDSNLLAIDISSEAISVAKENAKSNNLEVEFIESNLFEGVEGVFDIIVSNPPYIRTEVIKTLAEDVKQEPVIALDGRRRWFRFL